MSVNTTSLRDPNQNTMIGDIDDLIQKCQLRYLALQREHNLLDREFSNICDPQRLYKFLDELNVRMLQRLRYFVIDLYSVLDYLCYLCYCKYNNNGQPSYSREAKNINFPYKFDLKRSDAPGQEVSFSRRRKQFVRTIFNNIFLPHDQRERFGPHDDNDTEQSYDDDTQRRYDAFEEIILKCQVITVTDASGHSVEDQPAPTDEAQNFNTLHFLRNHSIHRYLGEMFLYEQWLYLNKRNGRKTICTESSLEMEINPDWEFVQLSLGCWISIPSFTSNTNTLGLPKPILLIAANLLAFVIDTRNKLLQTAFPHVDGIPDFDGHKVQLNDDGVHIGNAGDKDHVHYTWNQFDNICHTDNNFYAV